MNILFCSVPFRPSVGGVETVSALLADEFHALGHRIVLMTQTPSNEADSLPYPVVRRPGPMQLMRLTAWADVVFHNNISLRFAWPLLLMRRPWVIAHHMLAPKSGDGAVAGRIKHFVCRFAENIAVSSTMSGSLSVPSIGIPNPYADELFFVDPGIQKTHDLIFVGRLIQGKGVQVLLQALAHLQTRGVLPRLTIVGDGPYEAELRTQAEALNLSQQVLFAGRQTGKNLSALLNAHHMIVVPSVIEEAFGVVALEGIACGCVPIVARSGGLPDAVGPCGIVVDKGHPVALANAIDRLLCEPALWQQFRQEAESHLHRHRRTQIALRYLEVIAHASRSEPTPESVG